MKHVTNTILPVPEERQAKVRVSISRVLLGFEENLWIPSHLASLPCQRLTTCEVWHKMASLFQSIPI